MARRLRTANSNGQCTLSASPDQVRKNDEVTLTVTLSNTRISTCLARRTKQQFMRMVSITTIALAICYCRTPLTRHRETTQDSSPSRSRILRAGTTTLPSQSKPRFGGIG